MRKSLLGFLQTMTKELEMTNDAINMLWTKEWNDEDATTLSNLLKLKEQQEKTISYIKQYMRGLI